MCSTQLKVMAPSLLLSLKRSRKVPFSLSCKSSFVLFLLTKPMIQLQPSVSRNFNWKEFSTVCCKKKNGRKRYFLNSESYPSFQRFTKCFLINSRMPSIQIQLVFSYTHSSTDFNVLDLISWISSIQTPSARPEPRILLNAHLRKLGPVNKLIGTICEKWTVVISNWNFQVIRISWI